MPQPKRHPDSAGDDSLGESTSDPPTSVDSGPGCMPAVLATAVLAGIIGFISCGVLTWVIFQKQDVLALRAMRGSVIPAIEQSRLSPEEKNSTVKLLEDFADQLERKQVDGWQASGVMQRLGRLPILQWAQIRLVETYVDEHPEQFVDDASLQFDRIRKGVERNDITKFDFLHILEPLLEVSPQGEDASLADDWQSRAIDEVIDRARLVADRSGIEAEPKSDITIDVLVRRQVEAGIKEGTY
ncbi:hypothetical protein [Roseiconus lacunae]|uniref:Uncharacterized protein n=1 Tax=Roseiconus lacunae TaxID=2605694 RepID=A0ABT7PJ90_9BACT|nr:hypothetical protein [Roseiconus lacunae]MCD0461798.1 hypothetical protein [Roseiconus lacunae]MDM4016559.1 hypothetical protein [Roseiconus lacunae]